MKFVKFFLSTSKVGSRVEEVVEFEDDTTEEEINEAFTTWVWERANASWYECDEKGKAK